MDGPLSLENSQKSEKEQLRDQLIADESTAGTLFGSVIGGLPGIIVYGLLIMDGFPIFLASFIPGIFAGFGARFLGRGILDRHGRIAAAVVFLFQVAFWWLAQLPLLAIGFSVPGVIVALFIAQRKLTRDEEMAVYDYRIGRWRPENA